MSGVQAMDVHFSLTQQGGDTIDSFRGVYAPTHWSRRKQQKTETKDNWAQASAVALLISESSSTKELVSTASEKRPHPRSASTEQNAGKAEQNHPICSGRDISRKRVGRWTDRRLAEDGSRQHTGRCRSRRTLCFQECVRL